MPLKRDLPESVPWCIWNLGKQKSYSGCCWRGQCHCTTGESIPRNRACATAARARSSPLHSTTLGYLHAPEAHFELFDLKLFVLLRKETLLIKTLYTLLTTRRDGTAIDTPIQRVSFVNRTKSIKSNNLKWASCGWPVCK
ncbi:hypothetical protein TNCV_2860001 [Trichonephila clavipes]|nr:hypothetical protein TNCV_2860001 [Trichonephila clavipes]